MKAYATPVGNLPVEVDEVRQLIDNTMGRFFSVLFVGRSTSAPRKMVARLKKTASGSRRRDKFHKQTLVWDVAKGDWRVIPLERVVHFRCGDAEWLTAVSKWRVPHWWRRCGLGGGTTCHV